MLVLLKLVLWYVLAAITSPRPAQGVAFTQPRVPAIPPGFMVRQARDFGVACDGVKNDTIPLQNALNALNSKQALQLPAGTCLTSRQLHLSGKNNVAVVGAGKDRTILQAIDPLQSAFIVRSSSDVMLGAFQVFSPNSAGMKRTSLPHTKGFLITKSSGVVLDGVKARQVAGAGIFLNQVKDSKVLNSEVLKSLADAFHVTGGSQNVLMQGNLAEGAGDDGFASIGYGDALNRNIQFINNVARDGWWASGVSFEGTIGGKAYRNRVYRSGTAGIRIASQSNWKTGPSDNLDLQDNYLEGCVTRRRTGQGSVIIYSNFKNVGPNISVLRTTIKSPASGPGVQAFGGRRVGAMVAARVDDSIMSGVNMEFKIGPNAAIRHEGNELRGRRSRPSSKQ